MKSKYVLYFVKKDFKCSMNADMNVMPALEINFIQIWRKNNNGKIVYQIQTKFGKIC